MEVQVANRTLDLGPAKQRAVFAALAFDAGQPVRVETLIDRVWNEAPPAQARNALYIHIMRIRRLLACAGGDGEPPRLDRVGGGYLLRIDPQQVDLHRFRQLVDRARLPGLDDDQRACLLHEALGLWRGTPLADLSGPWIDSVRDRCWQRRLDAEVAWATVALRLDNPEPVIARARELAVEHPLVEPLTAVLMRALQAVGRGAEALEFYGLARRRLADELGVDPGPDLRELYQQILRGDLDGPATRSSAPPAIPAQLPMDVQGYVGRTHELGLLDTMLASADEQPTAAVVSVVSGTAGVGKTSLAVHWAHLIRDRFPDGQLYVNLRGFGPTRQAMQPAEAIRLFLDALGVPAQHMPTTLEARSGLYRSVLADRRMLIVLDNARDAAQIRPLLPGSPGSLVLITSRSQLPALIATEAAHPISLDLLSADEATDLLARRIGRHRVAAEPEASDEIVASCARLPLALAIVAARAAAHPHFPLATLAADLHDAHDGLDAFTNPDSATDVRSVFSWSYHQLTPTAARLFRLLGLHPGPDISAAAAASLDGSPLQRVRPLLTELAEAHLVAEHAPGRYTFHDLLRAYAAELAQAHVPVAERRAAQHRMFDHYLQTAHTAAMLLHPTREPITVAPPQPRVHPERPADPEQALTWFTTEHATLVAAIDQAARTGFDTHVGQLAWAVGLFLQNQGHWRDRLATQTAALQAARRQADGPGRAHAHRGIAQAYVRLGRYGGARTHLQLALDLTGDDTNTHAHIYLDLARMSEIQQRYSVALDQSRHALTLYRTAGSTLGQARALNAVGWCHAHLGDHEEALRSCQQALVMHQEVGDRTGQADTWDSIGYAYHRLGRYEQAADCYRHSLALWRELGSRNHEAEALTHLGDTHDTAGDHQAAREAWHGALRILDQLHHPDADRLRGKLNRTTR
jgi:DNA-binding SARP family transcriptional activator/tetratricopeptide (TPR) repeat protein